MTSDTTSGSGEKAGIDYDARVQEALRRVVYDVLKDTESNGLPGDHHFYITFKTQADGVEIPVRLVERYPDEMTIVLQHKYWGLEVTNSLFRVQLSFDRQQETLQIPFAAIVGFVDPSVKFALQFPEEEADDSAEDESLAGTAPDNLPDNLPDDLPDELPESAGIHDGYFKAEHEMAKLEAEREEREALNKEEGDTGPSDNVVTLDAFRKK